MTDEAQLLRRLQQLMDGYLTTQVLYAASELGVLDALASRRSGPLQARASLYYRAAAGLLDALRTGGTAFETVYGRPSSATSTRTPTLRPRSKPRSPGGRWRRP